MMASEATFYVVQCRKCLKHSRPARGKTSAVKQARGDGWQRQLCPECRIKAGAICEFNAKDYYNRGKSCGRFASKVESGYMNTPLVFCEDHYKTVVDNTTWAVCG